MVTVTQNSEISPVSVKTVHSLLPIAIIGALSGIVTLVLYFIFKEYIVGYITCRVGTSLVACSSNESISAALALIVTGMGGLVVLIRQRVMRPLLVVLAVIISLWNLPLVIASAAWGVQVLIVAIIGALVYSVFAWLNDLRSFWVALALSLVLAIAFQLLASS